MKENAGLINKNKVVCDCGQEIDHKYLAEHIRTKCAPNRNTVNRKLKVRSLKSKKLKSITWQPKTFLEMAKDMKQDEIYNCGARDGILVKYVVTQLENRIDQEEYGQIRTNFRMISKILYAVEEVVNTPVKMMDLMDVPKYYKILVGLGSGRTPTSAFQFDKVSL